MKAAEAFTFKAGEGDSQRVYSYPLKEVKALAEQLGMDLEVDKDFVWFLKEALVTILPMGWKKEEDATGSTQYHNTLTGVTTETHPLLYIFRAAYSRLLELSFQQLLETGEDSSPSQTGRQRRLEPTEVVSLQSTEERQAFFAELMKKIEKKQEGMKDTTKFEHAMKEVELFYSSLINSPRVPKAIEDTLEYQCVDPKKMMQFARMLGVHDDYRLLWVARVYAVLPLPPLWKRAFDAYRNEVFINAQYNITLRYHPSKNFFYKFIQTLKFGDLGTAPLIMPFLDKKLRQYNVDLLRLMAGEEDFVVWTSEVPSAHFRRKSLLFRHRTSVLETLDDVMALEIAESAGIEVLSEIHLLGVVYQYFDLMKSRLRGWEFRYTLQGEKYWYHPATHRATKSYPFKKKLRAVVDDARICYFKQLHGYIRDKEEIHPGFNRSKKEILSEIRAEASALMSHRVAAHITNSPPEVQDCTPILRLFPFRPTTRTELDDVLFANPFRLEDSELVNVQMQSLNLDLSSADEEVDAIEKEDVLGMIDDLRRAEPVPRPPPVKSKALNGLMAKPRAKPQITQEPQSPTQSSQTPRSKESLSFGSHSIPSRDIKDLVTEKALEAVKNLREAHSIREIPLAENGDQKPAETEAKSPVQSDLQSLRIGGDGAKGLLGALVKKFAGVEGKAPKQSLDAAGSPSGRLGARGSLRDPTPKGKGETTFSRLARRSESRGSIDIMPTTTSPFASKSSNFKSALAKSMAFKSSLLLPSASKSPVILPKAEVEEPPPEQAEAAKGKSDIGFNPLSLAMAAISGKMIKLAKDVPQSPDMQQQLKAMLAQSIFQRHRESVENMIPEEAVQTDPIDEARREVIEGVEDDVITTAESKSPVPASNMYKVLLGSIMREKIKDFLATRKDLTSPDGVPDSHASRASDHSSSSKSSSRARGLSSSRHPTSKRTFSSPDLALQIPPVHSQALSTVASPSNSRVASNAASPIGKSPDASPSAFTRQSFSTLGSPHSSQPITPSLSSIPSLTPLPHLQSPQHNSPFSVTINPPRPSIKLSADHRLSTQQVTRPSITGSADVRKAISAAFPQLIPPVRRDSTVSAASSNAQGHRRSSSEVPKMAKGPMEVMMSQRSEDYLQYYISSFGSPFSRFSLNSISSIPGVQPSDIVQMGQRLGMRVSLNSFESLESDMLWIANFQLLAPLPSGYPELSLAKALGMQFGEHPGDAYFRLMLDHQRLLRTKELKSMPRGIQVRSMVERSWLELRSESDRAYRYNFLTGESGPVSALEFVKFQRLFSLEAIPQGHNRTVSLQITSTRPSTIKKKKKGRKPQPAIFVYHK